MATSTQKIVLSTSRDIPFNKLQLSQANVRRVKAGISVEELAEDIARRGLLQSLNVRPILDADGKETDAYEIPAGGRRFRALEMLVKQKRLAKTALVPCVVREADTDILAEDDSLAENTQRAPLHPLDQFRAFLAMREKGMGEDEIAAAFFITVTVVKQRLRLASVSEKLLDAYADDEMTLEQLMAFTVSSDHPRQEAVWQAIRNSWDKGAYTIRRMLTEGTVKSSDKRARFIGIEAYVEAGGAVESELFPLNGDSWFQDAALLDRLVLEKLKLETAALAVEGWKWAEFAIDFPYGHTNGLRSLVGEQTDLTEDEQASRLALVEALDTLTAEYEDADELPDEIDQRFAEIEAALEAFDARPVTFDVDDVSRAGIFISLTTEGGLRIERAFVRPEDEAAIAGLSDTDETGDDYDEDGIVREPGTATMSVSAPGQRAATVPDDGDEDDDTLKPLPDRLVTELTTYRTLALRNAVANHPHVALTLLLHKLCLDAFSRGVDTTCLEARISVISLQMQGPDLKDSPSANAIDERVNAWQGLVPRDENALWDWLVNLDDASRQGLLAHFISFGVNAIYNKPDKYGAGPTAGMVEKRMRQADRLAEAVGLDMVQAGWRPGVHNYLNRVPKPRILEAVREARGDQFSGMIDHLKKGDMAAEAERLLEGTGWLPEPLRGAASAPATSDAEDDTVKNDLPEFLTDDRDDGPFDAEADQAAPEAAE